VSRRSEGEREVVRWAANGEEREDEGGGGGGDGGGGVVSLLDSPSELLKRSAIRDRERKW